MEFYATLRYIFHLLGLEWLIGEKDLQSTDQSHSHRNTFHLTHLPLPSDAKIREQDRIPYCSTTGYDGGSFQEYPKRASWPQALPAPDRLSFIGSEMTHPSDDRKLEDFLQTWLFFGLLHEIHHTFDSEYNESKYIDSDTQPTTVHTDNLKADVQIWSSKAKHLTEEQGGRMYRKIQECLSLASDALDVATPSIHPGFNRTVRQSIALLCDAITQVVQSILPQLDGCDLPMSWQTAYMDMCVISNMKDNNWCHREIVFAEAAVGSPSSAYFMERMSKPNLGRDHTTCDENTCQHHTTNETYRAKHIKDDVDCKDISIDLEKLASVLDKGAIPLIRLNLDEQSNLTFEVEGSDGNQAYVALSHVWAHGLGNKGGNILPICQLRRLANLLQGLRGRRSWKGDEQEDRQLLLWCDTLCVPVEILTDAEQTRLRNLAMESMRKVYQQSSYVLVVDETLETYNIGEIGLTEAALRIMTSPWVQRVWTLQEAVLPENLLFQFADMAIDIRDIWQYHIDLSQSNILQKSIVTDIIVWCASIRQPFHAEKGRTLKFRTVAKLLRGRRVSLLTDEAICLATIFGVEFSKVQRVPEQRSMEQFWKLMFQSPTGVPRDLIFNKFPRLSMSGLRWAPSTLLVESAIEESFWSLSTEDNVKKGQLSASGMIIQLPAFRIQRAHRALGINFHQARSRIDVKDTIQLRDVDGVWYTLNCSFVHEDISLEDVFEMIAWANDKLIVVTKNQLGLTSSPVRQQTGLVAQMIESPTAKPVLRTLASLMLSSMLDSDQMLWATAYRLATKILYDYGLSGQKDSSPVPEADINNSMALQSSGETGSPKWLMSQALDYSLQACQDDHTLLQLIQSLRRNPPEMFLAAIILRILYGQYLIIPEKFKPDQEWCID